eukprot:COSAG05_NODE_474_length_9484_cov_8.277784_3_plen_39_part_00
MGHAAVCVVVLYKETAPFLMSLILKVPIYIAAILFTYR